MDKLRLSIAEITISVQTAIWMTTHFNGITEAMLSTREVRRLNGMLVKFIGTGRRRDHYLREVRECNEDLFCPWLNKRGQLAAFEYGLINNLSTYSDVSSNLTSGVNEIITNRDMASVDLIETLLTEYYDDPACDELLNAIKTNYQWEADGVAARLIVDSILCALASRLYRLSDVKVIKLEGRLTVVPKDHPIDTPFHSTNINPSKR